MTRKELVESYVTVYSDMKNKRTNTQNLDAKVVSERKSFSSLTYQRTVKILHLYLLQTAVEHFILIFFSSKIEEGCTIY